MDRGIYSASSGGLFNTRRIDLVGHNLANVNTVGFKAERLVGRQQEFADTLAAQLPDSPGRAEGDHARTPGVVHIRTVTDFTPGPVSFTGNPLNVALSQQNEFFVVNTEQGEMYTRAGNFSLNADGTLVTPDGNEVLGEGGPITINGKPVTITGNGTVVVKGQPAGRLRVVKFEDPTALERVEGVKFKASGAQTPESVEAKLVPQSVELANVTVVDSMVEMIAAQKSFESYAKTVQTLGDLNDTSLRVSRSAG